MTYNENYWKKTICVLGVLVIDIRNYDFGSTSPDLPRCEAGGAAEGNRG